MLVRNLIPCIYVLTALFVQIKLVVADSLSTPATTHKPIEVIVSAQRQAIDINSHSYASPITLLNYDPLIDLQSRNFAEAQSDISIRGGTFENSGIQLGGISIIDPQTGHYLSELPISPLFLLSPQVYTGFQNDLSGMNVTAGSVAFQWKPIESGQVLRAALGTDNTINGEAYGSAVLAKTDFGDFKIDGSIAGAESDGSVANADSRFSRGNLRFQLASKRAQTDLFLGQQKKFFAWPYLYAPRPLHDALGSSAVETEDLVTSLLVLNHHQQYEKGSFFELSAAYRRNHDDYEFDRLQPGLFNPYTHTTQRSAVAARGLQKFETFGLGYSGQFAADHINSSALTFGDFTSRSSTKFAVVPEVYLGNWPEMTYKIQAGAAFDSSNHSSEHISPLIKFSAFPTFFALSEIYASFSQSTQFASYTALASNPNAGLFRGNKNLADEVTKNYEFGFESSKSLTSLHAALFFRQSNNMTDWVYDSTTLPVSSRVAQNLDLATGGGEIVLAFKDRVAAVTTSYTYLHKSPDYKDNPGDASFYALNFPNHRATVALAIPLGQGLNFRTDLELRKQNANALRTSHDYTYLTQSAAVTILLSADLNVDIVADNIWKENFEEIPGVPGAGRSILLMLTTKIN